MRSHLLPAIVALALGVAAARADAPVPAIDEAQLLAKLAATDPRLAKLAAELEVAAADEVAAAVRPNPSIVGEREEVFPDGGLATHYVRIAFPFDVSGKRGQRADAARQTTRAVRADAAAERFAITIEALRTFRIAAYARARVELLRMERAALANAVAIVRRRTTAGSASGYDLQRIELELAAYDDLIADAEIELGNARLALGALVGIPTGADAQMSLDIPADPAAIDANALLGRADLRAASHRVESADALARAAGRAWIPELTLSGGFMMQDINATTTARGYTAGLSLTIPLFDHGQADRARAIAQRHVAEATRAMIHRDVPAKISARHQALVRTIARARTLQRDRLARLELLLRSAETGYREGGGNVVELLDAYTTARDTRLRDLELRRDARLAELDLWLAVGRRP